MRKTKIVCTIGPVSSDRAVFAEMEGMTPLRVGDTVHLAYEKPLTPASADTPAILEATRCISVITS